MCRFLSFGCVSLNSLGTHSVLKGTKLRLMPKKLIFVASSPFAVNAFLRTHLLNLAKTHEVTLCVNTEVYPLVEDVRCAVSVRHLGIVRKISPWQDVLTLFDLIRCFKEIRPTVVHSMTPKAGLLAMVSARILKVPYRFHTFTGQVWVNKIGVGRALMKGIDRLIAVCSSRVFADSISQCRFLENQGVVRHGSVSVLGEGSVAGVDISRFFPSNIVRSSVRTELGCFKDTPAFLFVGRLVRDKGVWDLVRAFALVNAEYSEWELWIVGPDEEGLQADLASLGVKLGARIRWIDSTLHPERYMVASDALVLPSYREGFGSVIIEAAACGIACIAYRIDGVIDAIVENQTGLFVEKGNIQALCDAIKRLGSNSRLRKELAEAAYMRAVKNFSSSSVSAAWMDFYSTVLGATE